VAAAALIIGVVAVDIKAKNEIADTPPEYDLGSFSSSSGLKYFQNQNLRDEIAVTPAQARTINDLIGAEAKDRDSAFKPTPGGREDVSQKIRSYVADAHKRLDGDLKRILTRQQITRLRQLDLQLDAPSALASDSMMRTLALTKQQSDRLKNAKQTWSGKLSILVRRQRADGTPRDEAIKERLEALVELDKSSLDVLTISQKKRFEEMRGKDASTLIGSLRKERIEWVYDTASEARDAAKKAHLRASPESNEPRNGR